MRRHSYALALLAAIFWTVGYCDAAKADGAPIADAPTQWSWNGFYVGPHFGCGWNNVKLLDLDGYNGSGSEGDFGYSANGALGGVQAGYNFQHGNIVFGLEGEIGDSALGKSKQYPPYAGVRRPDDSVASLDGGVYGTIAGRLGYAFDHVLLYGKAGWGAADVDVSFIDTDPQGLTLVSGTSARSTLNGAVFGGGVELAISQSASLKVEYLRWEFGDTITDTATANNGSTFRFAHDIDPIDTVKVGLNFKLDWGRAPVPLK